MKILLGEQWCGDCYWFNCLVGFVVQPSLASWAKGGPTITLLTFPWKDAMLWQRQLHASKRYSMDIHALVFSEVTSDGWQYTKEKDVLKLCAVECPSEILKNKGCRIVTFQNPH